MATPNLHVSKEYELIYAVIKNIISLVMLCIYSMLYSLSGPHFQHNAEISADLSRNLTYSYSKVDV